MKKSCMECGKCFCQNKSPTCKATCLLTDFKPFICNDCLIKIYTNGNTKERT